MFTEILKVKPQLDSGDLGKLERTLNQRFANVAKKFGGGIVNILKGGGIAGIAVGLIDKILNPLKEVQESIDKTLNRADDLSTFAKQFNTTAGNLARLQAFGKATGLDPEGVRTLLVKFQSAVATAALKPSEPSAVSNFVGRKDTAEAFLQFVQQLQKLTPVQQNLVQQEVFGERQILRASEFLQADFKDLAERIGGPGSEQLTFAIENTAKIKDFRDLLDAQRELFDINKKADLIGGKKGERAVNLLAHGEDIALAREDKRLSQFENLERISMATDKMAKLFEDLYLKAAPVISKYLPSIIDQIESVGKIAEKSRALRGLIPGQGKDK